MRWRFRSRLKSSLALRLPVLITCAAAFWCHLVYGLSATSGRSPEGNSRRSSGGLTPKAALTNHTLRRSRFFGQLAKLMLTG